MIVEVYFSGRVQGVNFRYNIREKARELGLSGFVQNLSDGRVKALMKGPKQRIDQLIQWAKRGPGLAVVERVELRTLPQEPEERFSGFEIRY